MKTAVTILRYSHQHGENLTVHANENAVTAELVGIATTWWDSLACLDGSPCGVDGCMGAPKSPDNLTDIEIVDMYFNHTSDETYGRIPSEVDLDEASAASIQPDPGTQAPQDTPTEPQQPVETLAIDHGAITECPVWEPHQRGKNWAATIQINPLAPGGLDRAFWGRGRGADHFYIVPSDLRIGDAVEFAGDYYTNSGSRRENRRYRTVTEIESDKITMTCHDTARQAINAGATLILARTAAPVDTLQATADTVLASLNATVTEPGQRWYAEPKRFGPASRRAGKLAEIRFRLLTDKAARDAGLLGRS